MIVFRPRMAIVWRKQHIPVPREVLTSISNHLDELINEPKNSAFAGYMGDTSRGLDGEEGRVCILAGSEAGKRLVATIRNRTVFSLWGRGALWT
jgi:hypothetical protein